MREGGCMDSILNESHFHRMPFEPLRITFTQACPHSELPGMMISHGLSIHGHAQCSPFRKSDSPSIV